MRGDASSVSIELSLNKLKQICRWFQEETVSGWRLKPFVKEDKLTLVVVESAGALRDPILVFAAFLVAAWVAPLFPAWTGPVQIALGSAAVLYVFWRARQDELDPHDLGVRVDNLLTSSLVLIGVTSLAVMPLVFGGVELDARMARELPSYFLWASFQQFLVVGGFWRHFRGTEEGRLPPGRAARAAFLAAVVFGLAHAPNTGLMVLVAVAEVLWLLLFARFRNLFALALAHGVAALVVSHTLVPSSWIPSMKVGWEYWRG